MAAHSDEQEVCRILVLTDECTATSTPDVQLESQACMDDNAVNCQKLGDMERDNSDPFSSSCLIPVDIEKGGADICNINQETGGCIKAEIALTKPLRRQNSLQTGESLPPLMDHILMLLKFNPKEKQAIERVHDVANHKWRKYKRVGLFDSRQIVLLFSILSSMGTIVLIYLTLRVRQVSEGYIHG